jgi:hypothetical protein
MYMYRRGPCDPNTPMQQRPRNNLSEISGPTVSWAALPQDLLEQVLGHLSLRSVAAAARVCKQWAPAARVVRLRAQLEEALTEPKELIWRRYSGGAERMGREGYTRYAVEIMGWPQESVTEGCWAINAVNCGGSAAAGVDRAGFIHGEYVKDGRDAAADADAVTDEIALQALVAEAKVCGPSLRDLWQALEMRLGEAVLMRPLWTASASQLVQILVAQQGEVAAVQRCCAQLGQLMAVQTQVGHQDAAEEAGCSRALVAALQTHLTDAELQCHGCTALGNLVRGHPANQTAVAAAGGIEAALAALRAHPGAAVVQERGCFALGNLVGGHPANRAAVAAAGGIEAVVAALRAHPGAAVVQELGCFALSNLVGSHPANRTAAAAAGGIEAALAALRAHPGAETVQCNGCYLLGHLVAEHPANQTAAAVAGGIEAVVAALRAHPGAEAVQDNGYYLLNELVCGHPVNTTAAVRAGTVELAKAACARFATGTEAHEEASILLGLLEQEEEDADVEEDDDDDDGL